MQISEVVFRDKVVEFQFCELVEKEEPKIKSQDGMSEDDKMGYFQELGAERVERMIAKAFLKQTLLHYNSLNYKGCFENS